MAAEGELNLKKLAGAAWRWRWAVLVIQVIATAGAVVALRVIPEEYRSTTTIKIEEGKVINPLTRGLAVTSEMEERLSTIRQEILSRDYINKVITRLGLAGSPGDPLEHEIRIQKIIKNIDISQGARQTDTFQVAYVGRDPAQVRDITNLLPGIFIEESLAYKEEDAGSAVEFLQGQLEQYLKKLEESEAALRVFEERHPDELPQNKSAHLARLDFLRTSLVELRNSIRQVQIQKDLIIQKMPQESASAEKVENTTAPNPLRGKLRENKARLAELLLEYSESYPDVISLRAEIESLEEEIARRPEVPIEELAVTSSDDVRKELLAQLREMDVQINTLATREKQVENDIRIYEKKVQSIPQVAQEMASLKRDYEVNSDIYDMFLRRLEEARVSRELEVAKRGGVFRILEAAALPLTPYRPDRRKVMLIGIAVGMALNLALVYLVQMRDSSFQGVDDAREYLGLELMAGIPRVVGRRQKILRGIGATVFVAACAAYGVSVAGFMYWKMISKLLSGGN